MIKPAEVGSYIYGCVYPTGFQSILVFWFRKCDASSEYTTLTLQKYDECLLVCRCFMTCQHLK